MDRETSSSTKIVRNSFKQPAVPIPSESVRRKHLLQEDQYFAGDQEPMTKIDGFGMPSYRSFADDVQLLGPLGKINLVLGQNNSGKSNILRFASQHLVRAINAAREGTAHHLNFEGIDKHAGTITGTTKFAYALDPGSKEVEERRSKLTDSAARTALDKLLRSSHLVPDGDVAWFIFEAQGSSLKISLPLASELIDSQILLNHEWATLWEAMTGSRGGNLKEHWVPQTLHAIAALTMGRKLQTAFVPAIREVKSGKDAAGFGGGGLIEQLAELERPSYMQQELKMKFAAVNNFLRDVTGSDSATIEIPAKRDTIIAHLEGRALPLEALGTGIHEVVILASAATTISNHLVCIEEPEIHLHPILQRKLIAYLQKHTDNQYLIATHSSHLLDSQEANIFHVRLSRGHSVLKTARTSFDKFSICTDLGYRASDLLQSNCIIWVEGPSDRIYLRHWIGRIAPELIEGFQYSIMFYGGRLLSHLSAEDPEIEAFISLRRLNRHVAIIIDSDRAQSGAPLNKTKERIREELNDGKGFAWVTAGREIENYVPPLVLEEALRNCHSDVAKIKKLKPFSKSLRYLTPEGKPKQADKVKIACEVAQRTPSLDMLDLKAQLDRLANFIKAANRE